MNTTKDEVTGSDVNLGPVKVTAEDRMSVMVEDSMRHMLESDVMQTTIRTQLEKTLAGIIAEVIGGYKSPFKVALEEYVKAALPMDFRSIGLEGYQGAILAAIRQQLDASLMAWVQKGISEHLAELMEPPPECMTVEALREMLSKEKDQDDNESCYVRTEITHRDTPGYWNVQFIVQHGHREEITTVSVDRDGCIYNIHLPYRGQVTKGVFMGQLHGFELALFRFYVGKTKLVRED